MHTTASDSLLTWAVETGRMWGLWAGLAKASQPSGYLAKSGGLCKVGQVRWAV